MTSPLTRLATTSLALLVAVPLFAGRGPGGGTGQGNNGCANGPVGVYVATLPMEEISAAEQAHLVYMREEEKLARDLYLQLASRWNWRAFSQIARAEQQHMDAVKMLLDRYAIADPVAANPPGLFADDSLQALYDELLQRGRSSLAEAMKVGALVEETDLADLDEALVDADNRDIDAVYQNLAKGSRNHLRAYVRQLDRGGVDYAPLVLPQDQFDAIIADTQETQKPVDENGNPLPAASVANCPRR